MADEERMLAFVQRFLKQAEETIPRIARTVVELEQASAGADSLRQGYDSIARDIHGLKGTAAMLALKGLADLAHVMEDVVRAHQDASALLGSNSADGLLEACDVFIESLRAHVAHRPAIGVDDLLQRLGQAARDATRDAITPGAAAPATPASPRSRDDAPPSARAPHVVDTGWR
ncbi:MAG: Hpt domain-containing protein, partial [Polyangiaceae bacterium]